GADAPAILQSAGLRAAPFDVSEPWVYLSLGSALIRAGIEHTGDRTIGLHLSQKTFSAGFGVIGHIVQACTTLKEIVEAIARYEPLLGDVFFTSLIHEPGAAIWSLETRGCDPDVARAIVEFALGTFYDILPLVNEKRSSILLEIRFAFPPPESAQDLDAYKQVFRCPIKFNQPHSGLVLKPGALGLPLRVADHGLKGTLEQEAERQLAQRQTSVDFLTRVRDRMNVLIQKGIVSRDTLAADLGISSRHLHRSLSQRGTSYMRILDDARLALASELLKTAATLENIGNRLGFNDVSSFMRWYRLRTGQSAGSARDGRKVKPSPD
ncbi:MAG TPA: AraC family transcriptional regulator, partial [Moraxellaceae bacterium]|nr:AraC family transcriptional regulator [Moraxellaceae bacterium]